MSINAAKQQMSFLGSILESYEDLVVGKIGNSELTKEDYDQIYPEGMELIDLRWSREESPRLKQIEDNFEKEKSRACVVIQDDEGYDWSKVLPEEDAVGYTFTAHGKTESTNKHSAFVAVVKEKTKEEILKEKTYKERCIVRYRIEEMEKEYEEAKNYGKYDKKRECYVNSKGEPVVHQKEVVFDDVLAVIHLSDEYYSNVAKDKHYEKKRDKIMRDVAEEQKSECEKEEEAVGEEAVTEKQQNEEDLKKKEEADKKLESLVEVIDADDVAMEKQKKEADQKQTEEKAEVPITKQQVVNSYIEDVAKIKRKIADLEQDNNKLHSYHASSYVLERIFNLKPNGRDSEQNKKGIGSEYHQVLPLFEDKFTFYDDEKVEKAFNMVLKKSECHLEESRSSLA
ncbi:uncharacterized protein LOC110888869 [Helianthus annuus]|uniref:uncharacterized protein LOC110888869 n=1 Tax=Helianthus annuus TaxID=4232 RepID=UPI000B90992D|nr:uncharacterized protein LOC110888869 [Helianthus annuus]